MIKNTANCGVCPPNGTSWAPQEEVHLQGQDCSGNLTDFIGKPNEILRTVPVPGAVQDVRICNSLNLPVTTASCFQLIYFDEGIVFSSIGGDQYSAEYYRVRRKIIHNQCLNTQVSNTLEYRLADTIEAPWYLTPTPTPNV